MLLVGFLLAVSLLPAMAWAEGPSFTVRPVDSAVVAAFDRPDAPWLPGHRGVDLRAGPGTPVRAPADGVVSVAGTIVDRPVVALRHSPLGTRQVISSFEPVIPVVVVGTRVRAGQVIGWAGSGGHCRTRCLHWGVRVGGRYVDPLGLLAASVRLLPVDPHPLPPPHVLLPGPPVPRPARSDRGRPASRASGR